MSQTHLGEFEQLVLLSLVHLDGVGYGMQVRRELEERGGRDASIGAVYATLDRLEKKGLLSSVAEDDGGKPRRHYRLNANGKKALESARQTWERMTAGLDERLRPASPGGKSR